MLVTMFYVQNFHTEFAESNTFQCIAKEKLPIITTSPVQNGLATAFFFLFSLIFLSACIFVYFICFFSFSIIINVNNPKYYICLVFLLLLFNELFDDFAKKRMCVFGGCRCPYKCCEFVVIFSIIYKGLINSNQTIQRKSIN